MFRRTSALLLASWLVVPGLSLADEELDPEKVARIRRDEAAARAKVDAAHGNKKPSEMDNEERGQVIQEQKDASAGVLKKHGVTAKEYATYTAKMSREDTKAVAAAEARLEAEEKAKKDAEGKKQGEPQEVVIQQGISDKNPVMMEGDASGEPLIEQGTGEEDEATQVASAEKGEKGEKGAVEKEKKESLSAKLKKKKKSRRSRGEDSGGDE
jgi:hypothetical protein